MIKEIFGVLALMVLGGCASVNYTYEGQKYSSKESFHQAVDSHVAGVLASISPLPSPVSRKSLVFAIPSEAAIVAEATSRFVKSQGSQPVGPAKEILENIPKSTFKNIKIFFDAVKKKNIFASAQFVEMPTMIGTLEASNDSDALYYIEAARGSGQWFYHSSKGGKQIFAYDRSGSTAVGHVNAFLDAVLAQAARD